MYKASLLIVVCGMQFAACSGPTSTVAPTKTPATATLLAEKDLETRTGTSYSLDWNADGETLAVASGVEITLVDSDLSKIVAILEPSRGAIAAAWSQDEKNLATVYGLRNPTFTIWGWDNTKVTLTTARQVPADSDQFEVSWSPDGRLLATLANDHRSTIEVWDTRTWMPLRRFDLPYGNPQRVLQWSADSAKIYAAGELNGQTVYFDVNVDDGSVQELGKLPVEHTHASTFSPDLKRIAAADEAGTVRIVELGSGALVGQFQAVAAPADLAWNPRNATLAVLGGDTALQLWAIRF